MTSTTVSKHGHVAEKLRYQGFEWKPIQCQKVKLERQTISFESEWKQFLSCISEITGVISPLESTTCEKSPWEEYFQHVIHPAAVTNGNTDSRMHENEHTFSDALFEALRTSLQEFVDPHVFGRNFIVLKNSHIGFGKGIDGTKLGFKEEYVHSRDGRSQHGCFVFGTKLKRRSSSGATRNEYEIGFEHFEDDMTAAIVIQQDTKMSFMVEEHRVPRDVLSQILDFKLQRGIWGQAMVYSRDVWYCLARRGIGIESVPLMVLAGKTDLADANHICCLETHMEIPESLSDGFHFYFDRIVSFDGKVVVPDKEDSTNNSILATDERPEAVDMSSSLLSSSRSSDKVAIALYIKTLRMGLERALVISTNRQANNSLLSPVSLLFHKHLKPNIDAQFIASPIPNANPFPGSDIKIQQGELFSLVLPTKKHFSQFNMCWFVDSETQDILAHQCLVKVTLVSVHKTYVRRSSCNCALTTLRYTFVRNEALKQEVTKVLLGYSTNNHFSNCMVMRDLRDEGYLVLDHQKLRQEGKLPKLWTAFSVLVKTLLLPMAEHDVVHVDIRSTLQITYNILFRVGGAEEIELRLIDWDSLSPCRCGLDHFTVARQTDSIHWDDLRWGIPRSNFFDAYRYLSWQILWIAYTWHPKSASKSSTGEDVATTLPTASHFVQSLWKEEHFVEFKEWLGCDTVATLQSLQKGFKYGSDIVATLNALGGVFCGDSKKRPRPAS